MRLVLYVQLQRQTDKQTDKRRVLRNLFGGDK